VDLVPTYGSAKRKLGPDGKPLPREIVVPGQTLTDTDVRAGLGAYGQDSAVVAATLGIKNMDDNFASVIPLGRRYMPRVGDTVIGHIQDVGPSHWLIEVNSPYPAPMHVNEVPFHVEFGETTNFMKAGDSVIVRVLRVTEVGRVQVTMEGPGLRKLQGGQMVEIPHSKVPRVIGTKGSMISLIKKYTGCRLVVGQNGRIWIDGEPEDILIVMGAIRMIADQAHVHGLTNNVKEFLQLAKGIDPEVEAEEERKKAEENRLKREKAKAEADAKAKAKAKVEAEAKAKAKAKAEAEAAKAREPEMEEEDEFYDAEDELCTDPEAGGAGIVTVLSPDGESLMVVDEEDIPVCEPGEKKEETKEGD
jgi:exosome complex component RRP4